MPTTLRKRSVVVAGHRTSVSLEEAFWAALREIAAARDITVNHLVSEIDHDRQGNLSSAIRVFVLHSLRARPEDAALTAPAAGATPNLNARGS